MLSTIRGSSISWSDSQPSRLVGLSSGHGVGGYRVLNLNCPSAGFFCLVRSSRGNTLDHQMSQYHRRARNKHDHVDRICARVKDSRPSPFSEVVASF